MNNKFDESSHSLFRITNCEFQIMNHAYFSATFKYRLLDLNTDYIKCGHNFLI